MTEAEKPKLEFIVPMQHRKRGSDSKVKPQSNMVGANLPPEYARLLKVIALMPENARKTNKILIAEAIIDLARKYSIEVREFKTFTR